MGVLKLAGRVLVAFALIGVFVVACSGAVWWANRDKIADQMYYERTGARPQEGAWRESKDFELLKDEFVYSFRPADGSRDRFVRLSMHQVLKNGKPARVVFLRTVDSEHGEGNPQDTDWEMFEITKFTVGMFTTSFSTEAERFVLKERTCDRRNGNGPTWLCYVMVRTGRNGEKTYTRVNANSQGYDTARFAELIRRGDVPQGTGEAASWALQ